MSYLSDDIDLILHLKENVFYDATMNTYSSRVLVRNTDAEVIGHAQVGERTSANLYMLTKAGQQAADLLIELGAKNLDD